MGMTNLGLGLKLPALLNRAFQALVLLSLSSCCCFNWLCRPCAPWVCQQSCPCDPCYGGYKIYLPPANKHSGLELEMMDVGGEMRMYVNVYGLEVPPCARDPSKSDIFLNFRDHKYTTQAERLRGGQRLLLPECVRDEIIWHLFDGQPVYMEVGRYSSDIPPDRFVEIWHRMHWLR